MDVATSLLAAKQDLGVGKEMQGTDSLQSFFSSHSPLCPFVSRCIVKLLILQTL